MRKVLLATIVVVLTLGYCGVSYAYWTDSVTVDLSVSTGTLGGALVSPVTSDPPGSRDAGVEVDVACTETGDVSDDRRSFPVFLTNGYPGYTSEVLFAFENTGTIPEKVSKLSIGDVDLNDTGQIAIDLDEDEIDDVIVVCEGLQVGQVFYVGDVQPVTLRLTVCGTGEEPDMEDAPGVSGTFTFTLDLMQWNVPLPAEE